jgi:oxygen-independent coproporphyrinogen-3 oxidase
MTDEIPWRTPRAAYVHIPFCAHHCGYCDFAVAVGRDEQMAAYLTALEREFATLGTPYPVDTLFFGGGTPTHLKPDLLHALLTATQRWLPVRPGGEWSVEANPRGLTVEKLDLLAEAGVTRLSLGAQSFHAHLLHTLERDHAPAEVAPVIEHIRPRLASWSLDLIFGVPGQTLEQWQSDLATALALTPDHISTYGLTFEKGTPLWKQREAGHVTEVPEATERAMYLHSMTTLDAAGIVQYEISNFARAGHHCRHNAKYWANEAYLGFGVGAARYVNGVRELNTRDLTTYLQRLHAGKSPVFQSECLEPFARACETLAVQLRRVQGVEFARFAQQTEHDFPTLVGEACPALAELGLVSITAEHVALTREGRCVADAVIAKLYQHALRSSSANNPKKMPICTRQLGGGMA